MLNFKALIFSLASCFLFGQTHVVTNYASGRIGNHLLSFFKAKWVAEQNGWPFFASPVHHYSHLQKEFPRDHLNIAGLPRVLARYPKDLQRDHPTCFVIPCGYVMDVLDFSESFRDSMRTIFRPKKPMLQFEKSANRANIAIHIRAGNGEETTVSPQFYQPQQLLRQCAVSSKLVNQQARELFRKTGQRLPLDKAYDLMALPYQYYVDQIRFLYNYLGQKPLHVHLFTDHASPLHLAKKLKLHLQNVDVTIDSHNTNTNIRTLPVLQDLMGITQFDYLIRSNSTFAVSAEILGNFKVVISPEKGTWYGNILAVDVTRILEGKKQTFQRFY